VLGLTRLIKAIVYKFDNQKFLPVSLQQAKQNFYSLCQGTMTNAEYLEKYNNYVNIASSYDGKILDATVLEYTRLRALRPLQRMQPSEWLPRNCVLLQHLFCNATGVAMESYSKTWRMTLPRVTTTTLKIWLMLTNSSTSINNGDPHYPLQSQRVLRLPRKEANRKPTKTGPPTRHATNVVNKATSSRIVPSSRIIRETATVMMMRPTKILRSKRQQRRKMIKKRKLKLSCKRWQR
jgi:hypothetical protein